MTALPNKHYSGHCKAAEEDGQPSMPESRAAGLIALTRLSINRVKIFNRALIVNFSASHFFIVSRV